MPTITPRPEYPILEVPLQVRKVLNNGSLREGAFAFQLKDATGKVLATAYNRADGSVVFPNRTFTRAVSNYRYTISEVVKENDGIVYDTTVFTVSVTTRAVGGLLEAKVEIQKNGVPYSGSITFVNGHKMPPTGDNLPRLILWMSLLSLMLVGAALLVRKQAGKNSK